MSDLISRYCGDMPCSEENFARKEWLLVPAETVERVRRMERYFDTLCAAPHCLKEDESMQAMLRSLVAYYEGGQWLADYELDERGLLPPWLKRGVLSEDGVYNLLSEIEKDGSI